LNPHFIPSSLSITSSTDIPLTRLASPWAFPAHPPINSTDFTMPSSISRFRSWAQTPSGYTAQNSVVITVRNLNNVGKIIDAALANGANRIDSLNFTASDTSAAKNEALTDAVRSAKEKAQAVANALGVRLVRIANVYADTQADMPRYENYMPMMMAKGASAAATPIAPGELSVAATANVTYVIE